MISHGHYFVGAGYSIGEVKANSAEYLEVNIHGSATHRFLQGRESVERGEGNTLNRGSELARSQIVSIRHCPGRRHVSKYLWRLNVSFLLGPTEFIAQKCVVLWRIECEISCGRGKCQFADINFVVIQIKVNAHISKVF